MLEQYYINEFDSKKNGLDVCLSVSVRIPDRIAELSFVLVVRRV